MFYLVKDNQLKEWGDYKFNEACKRLPNITMAEFNEHPNKYIVEGDILVPNPNYEKEEEEKEKERVSHLKCTKRVFVLMLEQLGLDYFEQIEPMIEANRQAKLEWELCVELERSNPLLDSIGGELGITPKQLDYLFKYANGEITEEEFING